jgi:hypothetical protein
MVVVCLVHVLIHWFVHHRSFMETVMKTILKLWVALNEYIWGFQVSVQWDGKVYRHAAKDLKEAVQWMQMYPQDAVASVLSYGNDAIVMARGHAVS